MSQKKRGKRSTTRSRASQHRTRARAQQPTTPRDPVAAEVRRITEDAEQTRAEAVEKSREEKTQKVAHAARTRRLVTAGVGIAIVAALAGAGASTFIRVDALAPQVTVAETGATDATGNTTVAADNLKQVVATITDEDGTVGVTAQEVLEASGAKPNDDGSYTMPSADNVLSYARRKALAKAADEKGITASDDEIETYVEKNMQTKDSQGNVIEDADPVTLEAYAKAYNLSLDAAHNEIAQAVKIDKLYREITGLDPNASTTDPEDVPQGASEQDYAAYVIKMAGSEWDAEANDGQGGFTSEDGPIATAMAAGGYTVTNTSASYDAAVAARNARVQADSSTSQQASSAWSDFYNGIFSKISLTLSTLCQ